MLWNFLNIFYRVYIRFLVKQQKRSSKFAKKSRDLTSPQQCCFIECELHHKRKNAKQRYKKNHQRKKIMEGVSTKGCEPWVDSGTEGCVKQIPEL